MNDRAKVPKTERQAICRRCGEVVLQYVGITYGTLIPTFEPGPYPYECDWCSQKYTEAEYQELLGRPKRAVAGTSHKIKPRRFRRLRS